MVNENLLEYVLEAQKGNEDAFAKLYSRTLKKAYYLALKLTTDNAQAGEVLKKAYADAFCTIEKLKRPEAFEAWIKQKVAMAYKDTQSFVFGDAEGDAPVLRSEFLPASVLSDEALCRKIEDYVAYLPKEQRTVAVLYYCVGMPIDFIAKFMGVSESTVNSLMLKARGGIAEALDHRDAELSEESLPVLTRIFQRSATAVAIDDSLVRSTFIYAIDRYENRDNEEAAAPAQPAEEPQTEQAPAENAQEQVSFNPETVLESKEEAPQEELPQPTEEPEPEPEIEDIPVITADSEPQPEPQKSEPATIIISNAVKPSEAVQSGDDMLRDIERSIIDLNSDPDFGPVHNLDEDEGNVYISKKKNAESPVASAARPAPAIKAENAKPAKAKMTPKTLLYIFVALILVAAISTAAVLLIKKSSGNKPDSENTSQATQTQSAKTLWTADVFAGYEEIEYFNEYCSTFKSAETGKYGLIDCQGNVVIEPNYAEFKRCSYGRDYTQRDSYHYLVRLEAGGELYEISMTDFTISDAPHATHTSTGETLNDKKYSERDRYHNGYAAVRDAQTGKWGYVSQESDKLVIECLYEAVNDSLESGEYAMVDYCLGVDSGMVAVKKGGKMGVIDLTGNVLAAFEYDRILQGSKGVFVACKNGIWGILLVGNAVDTFELPGSSAPTATGLDRILETADVLSGSYEVVDNSINVRSEPGATSDESLLGELDEGTIVTAVATYTDEDGKTWICFEYKNGYGWGRDTYLEETSV